MQPRPARFALLALLAACGSDTPVTPGPVADDPGPVVTIPGTNLGLSADTICMQALFGGIDPRDDDVRITSLTGSEISGLTATIAYGPGQPGGWLTTTFTQTTTPSRLWLHVTTGAMPYGAWWADVMVSAPDGGTPRVIRVHFTVPLGQTGLQVTLELGGQTEFDLSPGLGRVTGYGLDCDFTSASLCSQSYPEGTLLTLRATPDSNSRFLRWQSAIPCREPHEPQDPVCVLPLNGAVTVTVYFALLGYGVGVSVAGDGADGSVLGSLPPEEINCELVAGVQSGRCSAVQLYGARTTILNAHAFPGSVFVGWGGDCSGIVGLACELAPRPGGGYSVIANFARE
jgi:hypothetical protein